MIELPEAVVISGQIQSTLSGKRIAEGSQGNSPHKFAFYSGSAEIYAQKLKDQVITGAYSNGRTIRVTLESGYILVLGEGGETILYIAAGAPLPAKYQLWLKFTDETSLTVSVQGWGAAILVSAGEIENHPFVATKGHSPLEDDFSFEYFLSLFEGLKAGDKTSAKAFLITKPGVTGLGNGCLQDILLEARLHPRHAMATLDESEKRRLYEAIRGVLRQAVEQGGRDTELTLFGRPGGYRKLLDARSVGQPCPKCGQTIQKESYLGGAVYFCPACQK